MRIMTNWRENNLSEFLALKLRENSRKLLNLLFNSVNFKINSRILATQLVIVSQRRRIQKWRGVREFNRGFFVSLCFTQNNKTRHKFKENSHKITKKFVNLKINSQIFAEFFCNLTKNSRLFINFYGFFATLKMTKCRKTQAHKTPKNSQKSVNFLPNFTTFFSTKKGFKLC